MSRERGLDRLQHMKVCTSFSFYQRYTYQQCTLQPWASMDFSSSEETTCFEYDVVIYEMYPLKPPCCVPSEIARSADEVV